MGVTNLGKTLLQPKLEVFTGGMFAGKSTALIAKGQRHLLAGQKVVYVKPEMDDRYSEDEIVTHDGQKVEAVSMITTGHFYHEEFKKVIEADVVLLDEVQFYDLIALSTIKGMLRTGKIVYCAGLDMDYTGKPFEVTAQLLALADEVHKLKAVCAETGLDAGFSLKVSGSAERVELGAGDTYKPVSRSVFYHHQSKGAN